MTTSGFLRGPGCLSGVGSLLLEQLEAVMEGAGRKIYRVSLSEEERTALQAIQQGKGVCVRTVFCLQMKNGRAAVSSWD